MTWPAKVGEPSSDAIGQPSDRHTKRAGGARRTAIPSTGTSRGGTAHRPSNGVGVDVLVVAVTQPEIQHGPSAPNHLTGTNLSAGADCDLTQPAVRGTPAVEVLHHDVSDPGHSPGERDGAVGHRPYGGARPNREADTSMTGAERAGRRPIRHRDGGGDGWRHAHGRERCEHHQHRGDHEAASQRLRLR